MVFAGQLVQHHGDNGAGHAEVADAQGFAGHGIVVLVDTVYESVGHRLVGDIRGNGPVPLLGETGGHLVIGHRPHIPAPITGGHPALVEAIQTDHWQTPLPIATVDRHDQRWVANSYWRGDVWPVPNYQVAAGFAKQGYGAIAADIADKTVANALVHGINEHYDSVTGKPLGVGNLGMSCAIVTMMLDRQTSKYHLKVRK